MLEAAFTPIEQPAFTQAPTEPRWFAEKLLELGGMSPTGLPMLRVVWSGQAQKMLKGERALAYPDKRDRELVGQNEHNNGNIIFHPVGAKETEFQPESLIIEPVFDWVETTEKPHWVLECWTPAEEVISGWNVELQGPLPLRGVYQIVCHIADEEMRYAPLNEATMQSVQAIWKHVCGLETENPYVPNTEEMKELRLANTRERDAEELDKRNKFREGELVAAAMEDRRRLHNSFRADFG